MVDQTRRGLAFLGTSSMRRHSPYCEATGPIVDEGFVAARIRDLQRVYHQKRMLTQSHSPMSPCPIYPKLQKYESFSRAEPDESPIGSPLTRTIGSGTPRSSRQNRVSARYTSNSDGSKAWNRSTDDLDQSKFLWPRYRKQIRKGYSASSSNLNDSLDEPVIPAPLTASERKEHVPTVGRRLFQKADQGTNGHRVETPKSGVGGEPGAASRSMANQRNKSKERSGPKGYIPAANAQPAEQQQISETLPDNAVDAVPFQVTGTTLSSLEDPGHPAPSAKGVANQVTGEHIASTLPLKNQRKSRPKDYGDLSRNSARVTDATSRGSDAENGLNTEAPLGISYNQSDMPNHARPGNLRRQSLPAKLSGPKRHPSSASTKTSSVASSTRSSSLWKKWRSWKLVLVDKNGSIQDLSNRPQDLPVSPANDSIKQPETKQANLNQESPSLYMQPPHKTRSNRNLPGIRRAEAVGGRKARFSVSIVPQTHVHQPPRTPQDISGRGTSQASTPSNITVNIPATMPQQFGWVANLPLDETLSDSKVISLSRAGGDDFDESTDSSDSGKVRKINKIQVVVSFDEAADLVIEAHLKGKKTAP